MGSSTTVTVATTESGLAQGAQDLRLQPAGWPAVHSLHSAHWLAVVPRWVLSSDSPLAALSPAAGSGTPQWYPAGYSQVVTTDNGLTILLVVTILFAPRPGDSDAT